MASGQREIANRERVRRIPPDPDFAVGQEIGGIGQRSRCNLKSGFHWSSLYVRASVYHNFGNFRRRKELVPLSEQIGSYPHG